MKIKAAFPVLLAMVYFVAPSLVTAASLDTEGGTTSISCGTASMDSHTISADGKSSIEFRGSCSYSTASSAWNAFYHITAAWNGSQAIETVKIVPGNKYGTVISSCPANPWLNKVTCQKQSLSGAAFSDYQITGATTYPLTANTLTDAQRAQLRAELAAMQPHSPPGIHVGKPLAPSELTAKAFSKMWGDTVNGIELKWKNNSSYSGVIIERKDAVNGSYQTVKDSYGPANYRKGSYSIYNEYQLPAHNHTYYYRVKGYFGTAGHSVESDYSNEAHAKTTPPPGINISSTANAQPKKPSYLAANPQSANSIALSWRVVIGEVGGTVTGFKIERKKNGDANYTPIATVPPNNSVPGSPNTYVSTGLLPGTKYFYRVKSYNATAESVFSNEAYATTPQH